MPLPTIQHPVFSIKLPSTKKMINFRPFLVKEEKLLLMAKESGEHLDVLKAIKQIINNTCIDQNFKIEDITTTDLSYLFLQLRAFSVDNKITQTYRDNEDDKEYKFVIDLSKVEVKQDREISNDIKVSQTISIRMKYPTTSIYNDVNNENDDIINYDIITRCIDKIYDNNEILDVKNHSRQELAEFVDNLSVPVLENIMEFLNNAPRMEYVIEYKNSLNHERRITLNSLNDFFTF